MDGNPLEADRLLEGEADAQLGALGDVEACDVLAVEQDLSRRRGENTGDNPGKGGFTPAVGASNNNEFTRVNLETDILEDALFSSSTSKQIFFNSSIYYSFTGRSKSERSNS